LLGSLPAIRQRVPISWQGSAIGEHDCQDWSSASGAIALANVELEDQLDKGRASQRDHRRLPDRRRAGLVQRDPDLSVDGQSPTMRENVVFNSDHAALNMAVASAINIAISQVQAVADHFQLPVNPGYFALGSRHFFSCI